MFLKDLYLILLACLFVSNNALAADSCEQLFNEPKSETTFGIVKSSQAYAEITGRTLDIQQIKKEIEKLNGEEKIITVPELMDYPIRLIEGTIIPFSLKYKLGFFSIFRAAIAAKLDQNIRDYQEGKIPLKVVSTPAYRFKRSGEVISARQRIPSDPMSLFISERDSFRVMYKMIKMTMTDRELKSISKGWLSSNLEKRIAVAALGLDEDGFVDDMNLFTRN